MLNSMDGDQLTNYIRTMCLNVCITNLSDKTKSELFGDINVHKQLYASD